MIAGTVYLERGEAVRVLIRWRHDREDPGVDSAGARIPRAPRNVLVERGDGSKVVRPFRGLRRGHVT